MSKASRTIHRVVVASNSLRSSQRLNTIIQSLLLLVRVESQLDRILAFSSIVGEDFRNKFEIESFRILVSRVTRDVVLETWTRDHVLFSEDLNFRGQEIVLTSSWRGDYSSSHNFSIRGQSED